MALVDSISGLAVATISTEPGGQIIETGPYGIEYYNALLGRYDTLAPVDMPIGSTIGIRVYGTNTLPWDQKMSIYVYLYDPNGTQIATGLNMMWVPPVGPGGRIFSGEVEAIAEMPGLYTTNIELYAVID